MLFKQHQWWAMESSEQQLLSSPQVGQEQPQDHLYTGTNSADPALLVKQTEERNEIFLFHFLFSVLPLTWQVWNGIKF